MKIYRIPTEISAVCFDIDNTLYRNDDYTKSQITLLKKRLGEEKGWSDVEVEEKLNEVKQITDQKQSHGNWFKMLGIPISESITWREELISPEAYLQADPKLINSLNEFDSVIFCALTNNPTSIGRRTLAALGVLDKFSFVVGLDDTGFSKPSEEPFVEVERRLGIQPGNILIVGDRFDVDLAVPLERGWGAVLVESMEDIYALQGIILSPDHESPKL